jgi:prepilin-type N-terminal cleavage/methylation domain-containing protein
LSKKGFTLIEVMIGLIFLAIGLLAIGALQITSTRGNFFSNNLMQASYIAQDRLEFLKNSHLDDGALSNGNHPDGTVKVPDIPVGIVFTRSYNVTTIIDPNGNYLKIDYIVAWNDGVNHNLSFSTIRSQ